MEIKQLFILGNAKLVKATGKGLVEGHTNEVNTFTVDTKNAGKNLLN